MSPTLRSPRQGSPSFPRVSGDEPVAIWNISSTGLFPRVSGDEPDGENQLNEEAQFSPREWG